MKKVPLSIYVIDREYLPLYATIGAAGADLFAAIEQPIVVNPRDIVAIPTGVWLEIPENFEVQIRSRSGLAKKQGIVVLNSPGTIDSDYRGEVQVLLIHHGKEPFCIEPKMRIAQMVFAPVVQAEFVVQEDKDAWLLASATERGSKGFGHTGV